LIAFSDRRSPAPDPHTLQFADSFMNLAVQWLIFPSKGHKDSQPITLVGQVLDAAQPEPQLSSVPIVLQGLAGLMGMAKTNEWGEFRFEYNFEPGVSLEIGARQNY
jgi:hypothetical protein